MLGIILAAITGGAAWLIVPHAKYSTRAILHVAAQPPQILFRTMETENLGRDEFARYQKTQIAWIKSRFVLNAALASEGIAGLPMLRDKDDPVLWLQENLDVNFESGSELLWIGLSGDHPEDLAKSVNAIINYYMDEVALDEHDRRRRRYDMLKDLKENYIELLKNKRQSLKQLAEIVGSNNRETLALKQQFALQHLAQLERELLEVQSQRRKAEVELALVNRYQSDPAATTELVEAMVDRAIEDDPLVITLRGQVAETEARYQQGYARLSRLSRKLKNEPALVALADEVWAARKALDDRRALLRPQVAEALNQRASIDEHRRSQTIHPQLAMFHELEARLETELAQLREGNHSLTVNTLDLQGLQEEIAQNEATFSKVASEIEALNVELQAPPRIRVMEEAVVPQRKDDKKRYKVILALTLGAMLAGTGGVTYLEFLTHKVASADEVALGLGIQVVGSLPVVPARVRREGLNSRRSRNRFWHDLLIESIDATRTIVMHATGDSDHCVLMVTSAQSGEGKTSLSSHLATSLARAGRRVLLIDCDLRRPSVHRLFDLPVAPGVSEVLRAEATLDQVTTPTLDAKLKVLPAGQCNHLTLCALAEDGLRPIFNVLKERFDYVVVDSSPVLPVADAMVIAQAVDAVVFSVLQDVSRSPKVFAAYQRLATLDVEILGAVVTGGNRSFYFYDHR